MVLKKLKGLKEKIKVWRRSKGSWGSTKIKQLEDQLKEILAKMEQEGVDDASRKERLMILNDLWIEYKLEERMWLQKSRVRWLNEGDKNTKFFHKVCRTRQSRKNLDHLCFNGEVLKTLVPSRKRCSIISNLFSKREEDSSQN